MGRCNSIVSQCTFVRTGAETLTYIRSLSVYTVSRSAFWTLPLPPLPLRSISPQPRGGVSAP